jgi:translation factor GUF1, mitochondrial
MESTFGINPKDIISVSAKTGRGVEVVLDAVTERIPAPRGDVGKPLKAFLFDSQYAGPLVLENSNA